MPKFLGLLLHGLHAAPESYGNQRPSGLCVDEIELLLLLVILDVQRASLFLPVFTDVVICRCS